MCLLWPLAEHLSQFRTYRETESYAEERTLALRELFLT